MELLAVLGGLALLVGTLVFAAIFRGYALSILWGWFIIPVFHLPPLSVPYAIGFALVVSYLTHQTIPSDNSDEHESFGYKIFKVIIMAATTPAFALLFGWIVHNYCPPILPQ